MSVSLLFADGDAEMCDLYETFLGDCGYTVETALDGLECMKKLRRAQPAVLVLDSKLHWGGAAGVLTCLRDESLIPRITVIITALPSCLRDVAELIEPPAVTCLVKPFAPAALQDRIHRAITMRERNEPLNRIRVPHYSELFVG